MKIRLKNTPEYGDLIIEFYDIGNISDFFGGIFGITTIDNKDYLFRGEAKNCTIYPEIINKLNKANMQFCKISDI